MFWDLPNQALHTSIGFCHMYPYKCNLGCKGKCSPMSILHNVYVRSSLWGPLKCISIKGWRMDEKVSLRIRVNKGILALDLTAL